MICLGEILRSSRLEKIGEFSDSILLIPFLTFPCSHRSDPWPSLSALGAQLRGASSTTPHLNPSGLCFQAFLIVQRYDKAIQCTTHCAYSSLIAICPPGLPFVYSRDEHLFNTYAMPNEVLIEWRKRQPRSHDLTDLSF